MNSYIKASVAGLITVAASFLGEYVGFERGYKKGFEAGKSEAQTPAFIVNQCTAWWFGSEREAKKMIDKYCEVKK